MKTFLGVLSDTHLSNGNDLYKEIKDIFNGAEGIIHAGDITEPDVLITLESIAPVWPVCGNMDSNKLKRKIPKKRIIEWQGKRIGVFHGTPYLRGAPEEMLSLFKNDCIDCLIFGHSHKPFIQVIKGILCFNPGSASTYFSNTATAGCLFLDGKSLKARITSL